MELSCKMAKVAILVAMILGLVLVSCRGRTDSDNGSILSCSEPVVSQASSRVSSSDRGSDQEEGLAIVERSGDRFLAGDGNVYVAGELELNFRAGVTPERAREIIAERGCEASYLSIEVDPELGEWILATVRVPEGDEAAFVIEFKSAEEVEYAGYENAVYLHEGRMLEVGKADGGPDRSLDFGEYYLDASGFNDAFDSVKCNGNVTVAVLDTGAPTMLFTDLVANVDYFGARNATVDPVSTTDIYDLHGHGTEVAGVISGVAGNNTGVTGASWNATILPIKISDTTSFSPNNVLRALDYLISLPESQWPDVINMSFGSHVSEGMQSAYEARVATLRARGIVCVASVGNDKLVAEDWLTGGTPNQVNYPAATLGVIGVGALTVPTEYLLGGSYDPQIADYSNTASGADICAHGSAIKVLKENKLPGISYQVVLQDNGTSFAAPQVSAAAALLKAQDSTRDAETIEGLLFNNAVHPSDFVDADNDGKDDQGRYGYGALDVAAAVGWTASGGSGSGSGSGGGTSHFTGPSDDLALDALQASYQEGLQRTPPEGIPGALERAMRFNPDVAAWLHVPGTSVSVPVALRGDGFYLSHDSLGNESAIGCAFTSSDAAFGDAVTVIYGHSFSSGGLAFTSLHAFEDYGFFAGHGEAYLYLPGRRIEYRVVGAYLYNSRAIEGVDQADAADLADYFAELSSPDPGSFVGYKRDVRLDPERDRLLQLSTCTVPADPAHRFVVTCVRVGEEGL